MPHHIVSQPPVIALAREADSVIAARIDALPETARAIFTEIESEEIAFEALSNGLRSQIVDAQAQLADASGRLRFAERDLDRAARDPEGAYAAAVEEARRGVERARARVKRIESQKSDHERTRPFSTEKIRSFFAANGGTFAAVTTVLPKGNLESSLKKNHDARALFLAELEQTDSADLTRDEAIAAMEAEVRRLAKPATAATCFKMRDAGLLGKRRAPGGIKWPRRHTPDTSSIDLEALFFWLHGDAIIERLRAEMLARDNSDALSERERKLKRAEIEKSMRRLEFEEAALIHALRASGARVACRYDMSVEAVLGINQVAPAPQPENRSLTIEGAHSGMGSHRVIA